VARATRSSRDRRYLNNATQHPHTLAYGQGLATVIGNVKTVLFQFDQLLEQTADAALRLAEDATLYADQIPYPADGDREQWMTARRDADALVTWDSQGLRPIGGIAHDLTSPAALANQLGRTITEQDDTDSDDA
jgi:hypothetical protein